MASKKYGLMNWKLQEELKLQHFDVTGLERSNVDGQRLFELKHILHFLLILTSELVRYTKTMLMSRGFGL